MSDCVYDWTVEHLDFSTWEGYPSSNEVVLLFNTPVQDDENSYIEMRVWVQYDTMMISLCGADENRVCIEDLSDEICWKILDKLNKQQFKFVVL